MYFLVSFIIGVASDLFYRRRHIGDEVPNEGALIIVSNHQNGGIDPIVVVRTAKRPIRLLAKAPLFKTFGLSFIVKSMRALPVYRKQDGADTSQNDRTFNAVYEALEQGDAIALFPEGTSHSDSQLRPLKTGAARMALGACALHDFRFDVQIMPLGLNFDNRPQFRSEVVTWGGPCVSTLSFKERYEEDAEQAARDLTALINLRLRALTLNLEEQRDLTLLKLAEKIWPKDENDSHTRRQNIAQHALAVEEHFPDRMSALRAKLDSFEYKLRELNLDVLDLNPPRFWPSLRFAFRNLIGWMVGLPIALIGSLIYALPFNGARFLPRVLKSEADVRSTVSVLAGIVFFTIWQILFSVLAVLFLGPWWGLLAILLAPLMGLYAHRFFIRRVAAIRRTGLVFGFRRASLLDLRAKKRAIEDELSSLYEALSEQSASII